MDLNINTCVRFVTIIFILCCLIPSRDTRMICKQKEFGVSRVLVCPPVNYTEDADLNYCCSNNGLMDCCSYDDYKQRHLGPDSFTTIVIIVCEVTLVIILVAWCYYHRFRK